MKLNAYKTQLAIRARAGGLTYRQVAQAINVSERTLYYWIKRGRDINLGLETFEIQQADLTFHQANLLSLYDAFYREEELETQLLKLDDHIEQLQSERERLADAREHKRQHRKAQKQRERARRRQINRDRHALGIS